MGTGTDLTAVYVDLIAAASSAHDSIILCS